jgi:hypothetical protein
VPPGTEDQPNANELPDAPVLGGDPQLF